jgi:N-acetylneuraminic acid mutarotase
MTVHSPKLAGLATLLGIFVAAACAPPVVEVSPPEPRPPADAPDTAADPAPAPAPDPAPAAEPRWSSMAPVPEARTEVSVTTDGERIYLVGGFVPHEDPEAEGRAPVSRAMWIYDPATNAWTAGPDAPRGTHHAGWVAVNGTLYLVGGFRENTFDPDGRVHAFDPATGQWTERAPMPTPRGALAYAVLNGRIHAIGGNAETEGLHHHEHTTDAPDNSVGTHEVYDPASDSWERLAPMPTARNHHTAATVNGRIYVTAGRAGRNFTMTVTERYDPATDSWTEVAPLPTGRSGVAAVALGGWMYVFGGETFDPGAARTFDDAERYNAAEDRWERLPPMPSSRHGLGAAVVDDSIYVVSGGPEPGFSFGIANERLDP